MTNSYDNQMLYAYLLGSLPNEDTEHLDEMTFTDPNFADQVDAAEKDLVDSYVNGELSGDMLSRFESYYLSSPNRQRNVLFAKALQNFAEKEKSKPAALAAAETVSQKEKAGMFAGILESLGALFGGRPAFGLAAAALLVALLSVGAWLTIRGLGGRNGADVAQTNGQNTATPVNTQPPSSPLPSPTENRTVGDGGYTKPEPNVNSPSPSPSPKKAVEEPKPQVAIITLLPPLRGGEKLPQVQIKPETSAASFTINLESGDYASYDVALVDQGSGTRVWQKSSLKPGSRGTPSLSIKLPAKLFNSHVYAFSVSGTKKDGTSENIGDYPFRVMR